MFTEDTANAAGCSRWLGRVLFAQTMDAACLGTATLKHEFDHCLSSRRGGRPDELDPLNVASLVVVRPSFVQRTQRSEVTIRAFSVLYVNLMNQDPLPPIRLPSVAEDGGD